MASYYLLSLAAIGVLGIVCQWLAWWTKFPAILYLLVVGIMVGPVTGLLDPNALFGDLLFPFVSLSVGVILFEGALTLRFEEIRGLGRVVRNLITLGVASTWMIVALATHLFLQVPWSLAFLFGALVVVTGPTVIAPMLRSVRPNAKVANILRWEGIMIDPLGALLAVLTYEVIVSSQSGNAQMEILLTFLQITVIGLVVGLSAAYVLGVALRRHWVPEYLRNVTTLTLVFAVFALSDSLEHESGLLAVTVMGISLANMKDIAIDDIMDFKESLSLLLISGLFIILAARVEFSQVAQLGWGAIGVLFVVMFVARPVAVGLSTMGSELSVQEKALLAWIAPRGIVAAAVSALFALRLEDLEVENAQLLVPLTFIVIMATVFIQGVTAGRLARWLGVADPEPNGVLIVGASNIGRAIGKALVEKGFDVLLADRRWDNIRTARMEGLRTYFGNPISDHADSHLDLVGIGRMLAVSARANLNALACQRFKAEFGEKGVYELQTSEDKVVADKHKIGTKRRGQPLFGADVTYSKMASLLSQGAEIRSTQLSENFDFATYTEQHREQATPLFAIDVKRRLHIFTTTTGTVEPSVGWIVISLIKPPEDVAASGTRSASSRPLNSKGS